MKQLGNLLAACVLPMLFVSCGAIGNVITSTHKAYHNNGGADASDPAYPIMHTDGGIPVGIIEFDDQGEMWEPENKDNKYSQLAVVLKDLQARAAKKRQHLVIFCHGWNNNGDPENSNLCAFKKSLDAIKSVKHDEYEQLYGVYISWRGQWAQKPIVLDYFGREATSQRIGGPQAVSCIQALSSSVRYPESGEDMQGRVTAIGHSMGGTILLRSIAQPLASRIADGAVRKERHLIPIADTIILVNPADRASYARGLMKVMEKFSTEYRHPQSGDPLPLIVSITSNSDKATGLIYGISQNIARHVLSPIMTHAAGATQNKDEEQSLYESVGFNQPLLNYQLKPVIPGELPGLAMNKTDTISGNLTPERRYPLHKGVVVRLWDKGQLVPYAMTPMESNNQTPFWIMRVPDLVSNSHGDIWNDNFAGMVVALDSISRRVPLKIGEVAPTPVSQPTIKSFTPSAQ